MSKIKEEVDKWNDDENPTSGKRRAARSTPSVAKRRKR